jgi:hypothetical protein
LAKIFKRNLWFSSLSPESQRGVISVIGRT